MTSSELRERVQTAYREYVEAVQDAGQRLSSSSRLADAVTSYARAIDDAFSVEAGQKVIRAYERYTRALQLPGTPEEVRRGLVSAYRELLEALQELLAPAEAQKRLSDAYTDYIKALQDSIAPVDVQEQLDKAYRSFARDIRKLWADEEIDVTEPEVFMTLAQASGRVAGIQAAASAAASRQAATATAVRSAVLTGVGQQMLGGLGSPLVAGAGGSAAASQGWGWSQPWSF